MNANLTIITFKKIECNELHMYLKSYDVGNFRTNLPLLSTLTKMPQSFFIPTKMDKKY